MNDSLPQLPEHDPHPDLWARIEADLTHGAESSSNSFSRIVEELPTYEPKADLWSMIEQELDTSTVRPLWNRPQTRWLWAGLTAAASIVLVGVWLFLKPQETAKVRIEYAVEQLDKPLPTESISLDQQTTADKRAEEFITRQCADQQIACQRPEVHELRNQLTELASEQQRIERERQTFGDDPVLVRAQVKIENQRAEVMKELITILRS